nr:LysR substrate-binding domain-containing protein [Azoarcus sp. L1K30]
MRHIEVFRAVMLSGSVSGAARMLHVSQPVVSRVLRHAEATLGFALFERTGGRLSPAPEAEALLVQVKRAYAEIERIDTLAANLRRGASGLLRVAATPSLASQLLPDTLCALGAKHPDVQCDLWAIHTRDIEEHLLALEIDAGIALEPPAHVAISASVLCESEVMLAVPCAWLEGRRVVDDFGWLQSRPCVTLSDATPLGEALATLLDAAGWRVREAFRVQTYVLAGALVEKGLAYAFVDGFTAATLDPARVSRVRLTPTVPVQLRLMRAANAAPSVLLGSFGHMLGIAATKQLEQLAASMKQAPLDLRGGAGRQGD